MLKSLEIHPSSFILPTASSFQCLLFFSANLNKGTRRKKKEKKKEKEKKKKKRKKEREKERKTERKKKKEERTKRKRKIEWKRKYDNVCVISAFIGKIDDEVIGQGWSVDTRMETWKRAASLSCPQWRWPFPPNVVPPPVLPLGGPLCTCPRTRWRASCGSTACKAPFPSPRSSSVE